MIIATAFCLSKEFMITKFTRATRLRRYADDLIRESDRLKSFVNDVKRAVSISSRLTLKVSIWLEEAKTAEEETIDLLEEIMKILNRRGFRGWSPQNIYPRYKMIKRLVEKLDHVKHLITKGVNVPFIMNMAPIEKEVWQSLENEKIRMIGLYGMGGVGKTTILQNVYNLINEIHGFELLIWVVVSKNATVDKVQDSIVRWLEESESDHATDDKGDMEGYTKSARIFRALAGRKFLLFLDDVWNTLDLRSIGIPHGDKTTSKVIFTTRCLDVCHQMKADKSIKVNPLNEDEAWILFQKFAGEETVNYHRTNRKLAIEIVKECQGLPLALMVMGQTMASKKEPDDWKNALFTLRNSSSVNNSVSAIEDSVLHVVKMSYESLKDKETKACFLYCSLFHEDYPVDKDTLIRYWTGERFLDKDTSSNDVYKYIMSSLINSCLLEQDGNLIKMHPLVCESALKIASADEPKGKYLSCAGLGLSKVPDGVDWKAAEKVSLTHNCITQLPENFQGPNISTLLLSNNNFKYIPYDFFSDMPQVTVLDLSNCKLQVLPKSIKKLLCLRYLNLSHNELRSLPVEIKKLQNLVFLDLSYNSWLAEILFQELSCFKKLQFFNTYHCGLNTNDLVVGNALRVGSELYLSMLSMMESLNTLGVTLKDEEAIENIHNFKKLVACTNSLSITGCKHLFSIKLLKIQLMKSLQLLEVYSCPNLLKFEIMVEYSLFNNLQAVKIVNCWLLEDLTWLCLAPQVKSLHVEDCMELRKIIDGYSFEGAVIDLFSKLEILYLSNLPSLESINKDVLLFPCLKEFTVIYCPELREVPMDGKSGKNTLRWIKGQIQWWDELIWEDDEIKTSILPYFTEIHS